MKLILKNELKKVFKRNYIIAFVLIALVLQVFLQFGNFKYLNTIDNMNSLQKVERAKVSHYKYFRQFASFGIKMMFIPSQFSIMFNDSTFEFLISKANIADGFDLDSPKKGKELFSDNSPFLNFMGVTLLLIFYFGISFGKYTTINKDYLRFHSSRSGPKKVLCFIIFFRLILLNAALLLMFVINLSFVLFNGINLFQSSLWPFFWGIVLVASFSFGIGCFLGTVKSSFRRNTAFFVIYVAVILLTFLLNYFTRIQSGDIKPVFEFDIENLKAVMVEEGMLLKKYGELPLSKKPTQYEELTVNRQSIFNQSEKIIKNLDRLKAQLVMKINARKFVAALFPTLFYFSICEDASTNSHDCFIDFFTFSEMRKEGFVQFCVDRIYPLPEPEKSESPGPGQQSPGDSQAGQGDQGQVKGQGGQGNQPAQPAQPVRPKVESFIKDNEDLFFASSRLPRNFWLGSILSLLWIAGFLVASYRRTLKQLKGEPGVIKDFVVKMKSNDFNYVLTADQGLKTQVQNAVTGEGPTTVKITIDDRVLEHQDILYVYATEQLEKDFDLKVLYSELFGEKMPGTLKPWEFLIDYAARFKKFLLLVNFFNGMELDDIDKFIEAVKQSGIKLLYIGGEFFQANQLCDEFIFCPRDLSIPGIAAKVRALKKNQKQKQDL
jgi:hypothetical protein